MRHGTPAIAAPSAAIRGAVIALGLGAVAVLTLPNDALGGAPTEAPRTGSGLPVTPTPGPTPLPGTCESFVHKWAAPVAVQLGQTVDVSVHFQARCTSDIFALHVVLVLDAADDIDDRTWSELRSAARATVEYMVDERFPFGRLAVVDYAAGARTACQLSADGDQLMACIDAGRPRRGRRPDRGIDRARAILTAARSSLPSWITRSPTEIIVLFAAADNDAGCSATQRASNLAKSEGIFLIGVDATTSDAFGCVQAASASPRYYFALADYQPSDWSGRPSDSMPGRGVRRVTITDTLPANMEYVVDPDSHRLPVYNPPHLVWTTAYVPAEGFTATVRLRPLEEGNHATNVRAEVAWIDSRNVHYAGVFPVPTVRVLPAPATPMPSPSSEATAEPQRHTAFMPACGSTMP